MKESKSTKKSAGKREIKFDDYKNFLELKMENNQKLKTKKLQIKKNN